MRATRQSSTSRVSVKDRILQVAVVCFTVSIALENTASRLVPLPTSLPTISAVLVIVAYILFFPSRRTGVEGGTGLRLLLAFAAATGVSELFRFVFPDNPRRDEHLDTFVMYLKLGVAFYILDRMVAQSTRLYRLVIASWACTLCLLAALAVLRIDLFSYDYYGRVGLVGENLNIAGHRWAGVAIGLGAYQMKKRTVLSWGSIPVALMMGILVLAAFQSGSKGATVALVLGLAGFLVLGTEQKVQRFAEYGLACGVFVFFMYEAFSATEIIQRRWATTVESGDPGMRGRLLEGSVELILRSPFFGYGSTYDELLGAELGRDAIVSHNTPTQVFLTIGIVGFVPFVSAILLAMKKSRQHAGSPLGAAVFAALVAALVSSQFGNWAHLKYFWLVLIMALNSGVLERTARSIAPGSGVVSGRSRLRFEAARASDSEGL